MEAISDVLVWAWLGTVIATIVYGVKWMKTKISHQDDILIKKMKKLFITFLISQFVCFVGVGITAPETLEIENNDIGQSESIEANKEQEKDNNIDLGQNNEVEDNNIEQSEEINNTVNTNKEQEKDNNTEQKPNDNKNVQLSLNGENKNIKVSSIPKYSGSPYIAINNNVPFFSDNDLSLNSYEKYSDLDKLGRCGVAVANIGKDIMPTEERGSIGSVKPTGWHTVKYDGIDGNYLYNRAHLIGYQLTGENANTKNLITGTRYMNVSGMLPFENMVADYVKETNNHVLYRVTPIFENNNLLASGVLIEAKSVEDNGKGILFNVYCYNVQPNIEINYANGESSKVKENVVVDKSNDKSTSNVSASNTATTNSNKKTDTNEKLNNSDASTSNIKSLVLNTNTMKYHTTGCSSAKKISEKNKKEYTGTEQALIDQGYTACKICH